jgi:threonine dehydrogenase-like Zn-dependent dehydrogenase
MRAVVMRNHELVVDNVPTPKPGPGEVLVKTLACGICGSDLHTLKYAEQLIEASRRTGGTYHWDVNRDVVLGHEFCAEIVDHGPHTRKTLKAGTRVCSMPVVIHQKGVDAVGFSNDYPGGYGEYMRLTEGLLLEVPNGLSPDRAALVEPLAVGLHAVEKARLEKDDVPLVIGCGPVGLAVIAALRLKGVRPIVAAEFSPRRRDHARQMGADIVVDPKEKSPYQSWQEAAIYSDPSRAPVLPPWVPGPSLRPAVIFECVGVPGVIEQIMASAAPGARIVVVGVCMGKDTIEPLFGIGKELNIQYVLAYTPEEFGTMLRHVAEGKIPTDPLITGTIGVGGVPKAFQDLASPENHVKIMIEPWRS